MKLESKREWIDGTPIGYTWDGRGHGGIARIDQRYVRCECGHRIYPGRSMWDKVSHWASCKMIRSLSRKLRSAVGGEATGDR